MSIKEEALKMKLASPKLAASPMEIRNGALGKIAEALKAHAAEIFAANALDMNAAAENGISENILKRLKYDEAKLSDSVSGIEQLMTLADPINKTTLSRQLSEGLNLYRVTCPIGVIGVIFEARPDALVQISSLCIKSGNCAILKGGKETANTNRVLFRIIHEAALEAGLPSECLLQAESHSEIDELLSCHEYVNLLIPRGSNEFVRYIMDHTKIPVMGHADGICHIYVDESADFDEAVKIIVDAKTQYSAACNAVETILVNRSIAKEFLPILKKGLDAAKVKIRATEEAVAFMPGSEIIADDDFRNEYLAFTLAVKLVSNVEEAVEHINFYGSHHTDSILSKDNANIEKFMQLVDSAGVYANCSTRFADGFRYGFGAEVGISTGKIHARGPVGLEGLVTYKYRLFGGGHIVADFASGKSRFEFKELDEI